MNMSRSLWLAGLVVAIGCVGCQPASSPPHPETSPLVRHDAVGGAGAAPTNNTSPTQSPAEDAQGRVQPGTPQALAQRATSYAQSVEPLVARHGGQDQTDQTQWPDPDALRLTAPHEVKTTEDPGSRQGSESQVMGNSGVSLSHETPAVVPRRKRDAAVSSKAADEAVTAAAAAPADSDSLSAQLERRAKDFPEDITAQVDDQLLKLLRDEPVPDAQSLSRLQPEDRELLGALMDSLTNFRNAIRQDHNMLFTNKIRPLAELSDRLRGQAELAIPTVALCTAVRTFGSYDPIDPPRFVAGATHQAVVYCEVENFRSEITERGQYETRLSQDIVLYTESSGLPVWSDRKTSCVDTSRRRRHDFFLRKIIALPANLTIGRYLLKVTIEDEQARRIAENTIPVEFVAQ